MAKNQKTHKPMTGRTKSTIALCVLLVITLVVSYLGIAGTVLGPEESRRLLPFMPMNAEMEAYTLPASMSDGILYEVVLPASAEGMSDQVADVIDARLAHYGVRGYSVEKQNDELIHVLIPDYADYEMIATLISTTGSITFTDDAGTVLLNNEDFASADLVYANGYYYIDMHATKEGKAAMKAATEANNGGTININLDGALLISPEVNGVNTNGEMTLSFGLTKEATASIAAMLVNEPLSVVVTNVIVNDAEATNPGSLTAILCAVWAAFAVAVVLLVVKYRAAGVGAAWTMWAYMLLFFFLMCTVTRVYADMVVWAVVIMGEVLAVHTLSQQLQGMKAAVAQGREAAAAIRQGFRTSAKQVWLAHAVVLVISLLLMILNVTRPYGYTLATVVVASVVANLLLVRALVPCLVSVAGGKTCAICGKTSK